MKALHVQTTEMWLLWSCSTSPMSWMFDNIWCTSFSDRVCSVSVSQSHDAHARTRGTTTHMLVLTCPSPQDLEIEGNEYQFYVNFRPYAFQFIVSDTVRPWHAQWTMHNGALPHSALCCVTATRVALSVVRTTLHCSLPFSLTRPRAISLSLRRWHY